MQKLAQLKRNAVAFAVAMHNNQLVYLTGGTVEAAKQASIFRITENTWEETKPMMYGRFNHSSICLNEFVYVFGGFGNDGYIERMRAGSKERWAVCYEPSDDLTKRSHSAVTVINSNHIAVFGGARDFKCLRDGYVLNTETLRIKTFLSSKTNKEFETTTHVQQISPAEYITLGKGRDGIIHLLQMKYSSEKKNYWT